MSDECKGGYLIEPAMVPALERLLNDGGRLIGRDVSAVIEDYDEYSDEKDKYDLLREFVEDLASKGTRHDTNPTMCFSNMWEVAGNYVKYVQSMDKSIRDRARDVLSIVDKR